MGIARVDTPGELEDSVRRVLGGPLPMCRPRRLSRFTFQAGHADRYREGRILLAGDAAHLLPATGAAFARAPSRLPTPSVRLKVLTARDCIVP